MCDCTSYSFYDEDEWYIGDDEYWNETNETNSTNSTDETEDTDSSEEVEETASILFEKAVEFS